MSFCQERASPLNNIKILSLCRIELFFICHAPKLFEGWIECEIQDWADACFLRTFSCCWESTVDSYFTWPFVWRHVLRKKSVIFWNYSRKWAEMPSALSWSSFVKGARAKRNGRIGFMTAVIQDFEAQSRLPPSFLAAEIWCRVLKGAR